MKPVRLLALAFLALACSRGPAPEPDAGAASARKVGAVVSPGPDFQIGQGDRNVPFAIPVFDQNGQPINLAGATVFFRYRTQTHEDAGVAASGKVTGAAPGMATYVFTSNDTATAGTYNASFFIVLPIADGGVDGSQEALTYPQTRFLRIKVNAGP